MADGSLNPCRARVINHLAAVYPDADVRELADELLSVMRLDQTCTAAEPYADQWDESDVVLITYGDFLVDVEKTPLRCLHRFLQQHFSETVSIVHVLPFFPWSSDDGFAVIDYSRVNDALGDWDDIEDIAADYALMADLVINHCSSRSQWFDNFKQNKSPGNDFFICPSPQDDLSQVVRPRTSKLLREVQTAEGIKHVWCTFSHDQVDLNFSNPQVLIEMVRIIRLYLDRGVRVFRLDAVAFLWKEAGTSCLSRPQTHELVRLLRCLVEHAAPGALVITETNIPNRENLSYFGNGNEAHCIYNFSLPPLLVNAMITGSCRHLKTWMMSMPPAQPNTCYLNFIASHDGIGLRPAEGLLGKDELEVLLDTMQRFGGRISWRAQAGNRNQAYEINISLFDAMQGTVDGADQWQIERFICAHAIMLALEGIPALYLLGLVATPNDYRRLAHSNHNRHINRRQWRVAELEALLADPASNQRKVLDRMRALIGVRAKQPAFHPNATQFTLHLGDKVFGIWRQSQDRRQSIFAVNNITNQPQRISLSDLNLIDTDRWQNLLAGMPVDNIRGELVLAPYQSAWISNR